MATPCWPAPVSAMIRALAHPLGQQRLAERVVDLVGAGVVEVLALEVDGVAGGVAQPPGQIQRRWAADVVAQQAGRARPRSRGRRGPRPRPPRARPAPASASPARTGRRRGRTGARRRSRCRRPRRRPPRRLTGPRRRTPRAWPGPCGPGRRSTPLATSTAYGRTVAIASATLSGVRPPERITGTLAAVAAEPSSQANVSPVPPRHPAHVAVEQMEVGVEGGQRLDVGAAAHARGLDHPAAGAPGRPRRRTPGPRRRAAGCIVRPIVVGGAGDLVERRVDEHAGDLDVAPVSGGDLGGHARVRQRRGDPGHRIIPIAQAPAATASSASSGIGDPAELDLGGVNGSTPHIVRTPAGALLRAVAGDGPATEHDREGPHGASRVGPGAGPSDRGCRSRPPPARR